MHPNLHEPPEGQNVICHIAIPTHDLDAAVSFYEGALGCPLSRRYDDRVTFDFFDHQLVCHLCPDKIDTSVSMYPRHFGVTFVSAKSFDSVHARAKAANCPFFKDMYERFSDLPERHRTYFLVDPSNNLVEFKHYYEPKYIY
jgi:extradiol dioxygenase family protein